MSRGRNNSRRPASVLTIAGSDSGGGAGIQADLKTFAAFGVHGLSAITAVTAQNTVRVTGVHVVPARTIERQIDAVFDDFAIGAVKLGMLATRGVVRTVARALRRRARDVPIVVDPVMVATSGDALLAADAIAALRRELLPLAAVVTPNLPEAELLLGRRIRGRRDMDAAARALLDAGPCAVVLKGGHLARGAIVDLYVDAATRHAFEHPRLRVAGHGTGCTLAAALAAGLALGRAPADAARAAVEHVNGALRNAFHPGRGAAVLDVFWRGTPTNARSG
jgi:hydroxymethylpyrimidine/phosphomethylpyrimidine kinase